MWLAISTGPDDLHIIPHNDLIEHTQDPECVCMPAAEFLGEGKYMYTHSSLDGREVNEPDWKR